MKPSSSGMSDRAEKGLPSASIVAEPGYIVSASSRSWILGDKPLGVMRRFLPPVGAIIHIFRIFTPRRFFGTDNIPKDPIVPFVISIIALSIASWIFFLPPDNISGWLIQLKTLIQINQYPDSGIDNLATYIRKSVQAASGVLDYFSNRASKIVFIIFWYAIFLSIAELIYSMDRQREWLFWKRAQFIFARMKGYEKAIFQKNMYVIYAGHICIVVVTVLASALLITLSDSTVPLVILLSKLQIERHLSLIIIGVLILAWIVMLIGYHHYRNKKINNFISFEDSGKPYRTLGLPRICLDGLTPLPQMESLEPLQYDNHDLNAIGNGKMTGRVFSTLFLINYASKYHYLPMGNHVGKVTIRNSVLKIFQNDIIALKKVIDDDAETDWSLPEPQEIVNILLKVMYLSASVSGRIGKRHNSVIKEFCKCYELCLAAGEEQLSKLVLEMAELDWTRKNPEAIGCEIIELLKQHEEINSIDEYLMAWISHHPTTLLRRRTNVFDPLSNGGFQNIGASVSIVGKMLVQAIVYSDRRIDANESILLSVLGLIGDYDSKYNAHNVGAGE